MLSSLIQRFRSFLRPEQHPTSRPRNCLGVEALEDRTVPAVTLPAGFTQSTFASGLNLPTSMAFAPDGRLFVTEKAGSLRVIESSGTLLPTPFLQLDVVTFGDDERGLLGVAFDPNFAANRFLYVFYSTVNELFQPINRVSRFTASAANPNVVDAGSELILLDDIPAVSGYHNGGSLHFGKDDKLYISVGEGYNEPDNAQNLSNLLGKILRINSDGTIPGDNPFVGQEGAREEIWAYGLRNPFSFAVRPSDGKIFVNDVGENTWEEINQLQKGGNYGWPAAEGVGADPNFINPVHAYKHAQPGQANAAITGGVFQESNTLAAAHRGYYFADYLLGFIRILNPTTNKVTNFAANAASPIDLDVAPNGNLMYLSLFTGNVFAIKAKPPSSVTFIDQDNDQYTVKLTGPGEFNVVMNDPESDGKGPMTRIDLLGTDAVKSTLSITVKKAVGGDGLVTLGALQGPGLKGLTAPAVDLVGAGVQLDGALGGLTLHDILAGANITATAGPVPSALKTTIVVHVVQDEVVFNLGTAITSFKAAVVGDAAITAPSLGTLSILGDKAHKVNGVVTPIRGDFGADLTLTGTGDPKKPSALTAATIAGHVTGAAWDVTGDAGKITVTGMVDAWDLNVSGKLAALTLGNVNGAMIEVGAHVASIKVKNWAAGLLTAPSVGALNVTENLGASVNVTGTGVQPGKPALGSATVLGTIAGAAVTVAGNVGAFKAGAFLNSRLYVGFVPANPLDPFAGGTFTAAVKLTSFTVTGLKNVMDPAFADSFVGAPSIGAVNLKSVDDDTAAAYGVFADVSITGLTVTNIKFKYDPKMPTPQGVGDFEIRIV